MTEVGRASAWQFWIDRGGTFTDVVARTPAACDPGAQAPVRQSGAVRRRGARRVSAQLLRPGAGRADPGERDRRGQDGHHGRDQRPARAPRRADHARDHRAASATRCASATSIAPTSSPGRSCCRRCCTPTWWRSTSACAPTARSSARSISASARRDLEASLARGRRALAIVLMHGYRHHAHELALAELAREHRLRPGLGQPSGLAADEAGRAAATPRWSTPICRRSCGATSISSRARSATSG